MRRALALFLCPLLASGCLSNSYEVPREELQRLVQTPPAERGQHVRATQRFSTSEEPEPAPGWERPQGPPPPGYAYGPQGYFVPRLYLGFGSPAYDPYYGPARIRGGGPGFSTGSRSSSSRSSSKDDAKGAIIALVLAGVVIGTGLAFTEGARYDGWLAVHPHHPVHLLNADGNDKIVALDELTLQAAAGRDAVIVAHEGAGAWQRGRAPLSRQGLSFQFGLGQDAMPDVVTMGQQGLGWRMALGWYPSQYVGVLLDSRLLVGSDEFGNSWHHVRLGAEGQWLPVQLWRLHLGGLLGGGQSWAATYGDIQAAKNRPYIDFGAIAEVDLTTRLGLSFRWVRDVWLNAAGSDGRTGDGFFLGLQVY